jgi:hypothetical protein
MVRAALSRDQGGTISAHSIRFSVNAPSRLDHNVRPDEGLLYQVDGSHFRLDDSSNDPTPIHSKSDVGGQQDQSVESDEL